MRRWLYLLLLAPLAVTQSHQAVVATTRGAAFHLSAAAVPEQETVSAPDVRLPLESNSIRFAVIGDSGTGGREQYDVAQRMQAYREIVKFDFVIMLGDNIYGGHEPSDFHKKFEDPYRPLLDAGVKFYAALGNHDDANLEPRYKPFNMGGERYYTFNKSVVEFFVLDSNYMDPAQLTWLEQKLTTSKAKWRISYFHHPLYSDGRSHGPDLDLRRQLTPLFKKYCINAVFSGHEHIYERILREGSIYYFILGNSGKLMTHDLQPSDRMVKGFDTDRGFMLVEISGDTLYFQAISRTGETIDSGSGARQSPCAMNTN